MGVMDKFLNIMKLNDTMDEYDTDDYYDEEDDYEEPAPKRGSKVRDFDDFEARPAK